MFFFKMYFSGFTLFVGNNLGQLNIVPQAKPPLHIKSLTFMYPHHVHKYKTQQDF